MVNKSEDRMYRYHHKALSEINTNQDDHDYCRSILHLFLSILEILRAQTRAVHGPKGYAIPYNIHTQAKKRHLSSCCASRSSQNPAIQLHAMHKCDNKDVAAAESRRRKWNMDKRNSSPVYPFANGSPQALPYPELMYTPLSLQPHARLIRS